MGHNRRLKPRCNICTDTYSAKRANAGYNICMPCGDAQARAKIRSYTVVPMHKSNYMLFTDLEDLKELNPKRIQS
jgi:ribosomal protein L37AE/L43A